MFQNKINLLKNNLFNLQGWRTNRKIVVFESDDWGSIRTSSKEDLNFLRKKNFKVDRCNYMLNDSLASETDLEELFNVLVSFKDNSGNHPVFTANCLVANPNFIKIKNSNYSNYYYEPFYDTLKKYPEHSKAFNLWKKGMSLNIFHPQSHGREHLNISRWMKSLKNSDKESHLTFDMEMFGISAHISKQNRGSYQAAFDGAKKELIYDRKIIIQEALTMFEQFFGYKSKSFISPNYVWDEKIEEYLKQNDVNYIQSSRVQRVSSDYGDKKKIKRHYIGQKNKLNQIYIVRNCKFEPTQNLNKNWVNSCLKEIEVSFKHKKPAVIISHRVNYIGFINQKNREDNLPLLNDLLRKMLIKWPSIEFMTSDQLGKIIYNDGK